MAMQCEWLGERVATVDATRAIRSVIEGKEDAGWGPNAVFRQAGPVSPHAHAHDSDNLSTLVHTVTLILIGWYATTA